MTLAKQDRAPLDFISVRWGQSVVPCLFTFVLFISGGKVTSSQSSLRVFSTSSSTVTFLLVLMVPSTSWWKLWTFFFHLFDCFTPLMPMERALPEETIGKVWPVGSIWKWTQCHRSVAGEGRINAKTLHQVSSPPFFLNVLFGGGDVYCPAENMQIVWNELL